MDLEKHLRRLIEREGPIPFSRFMEEALYHPEMGYYSTGKPFRGEGDFYTGPSLHPLFGWTVARFLISRGGPWTVLEIGPGKGFLASDILDYLSFREPKIYRKTRYLILEKSPALRAQGERLLSPHSERVEWLESLPRSFSGVILANEVLDSFAFDRFVRETDGWSMMMVALGDPFSWTKAPAREDALALLPDNAPEGFIYDLSVEAISFLAECASCLEGGYMLVIDYGYPRAVLFSSYPQGTLTCYYKHTVSNDPFERVGNQDITYFLDWDIFRLSAARSGLTEEFFVSQAEFLMSSGIHLILSEMETAHSGLEVMKARLAAKNLLLTFKNYRVAVWAK
jgi:SAM-dependent MidA family methyltransferase